MKRLGINNIIPTSVHTGSVCTTRRQTGVGYPQLSAVLECADAAHGLKGHIISVCTIVLLFCTIPAGVGGEVVVGSRGGEGVYIPKAEYMIFVSVLIPLITRD